MGKPTYQTKGQRFESIPYEFRLEYAYKLKEVYDIPKSVQIQNLSPITIDNDLPSEVWHVFHKIPLQLDFIIPLPTLLDTF